MWNFLPLYRPEFNKTMKNTDPYLEVLFSIFMIQKIRTKQLWQLTALKRLFFKKILYRAFLIQKNFADWQRILWWTIKIIGSFVFYDTITTTPWYYTSFESMTKFLFIKQYAAWKYRISRKNITSHHKNIPHQKFLWCWHPVRQYTLVPRHQYFLRWHCLFSDGDQHP